MDVLSSAEKKEKKETARGLFPVGQTHLAGCVTQDFHSC
jgi:hypothetical protein